MRIGELAAALGVTTDTVRYYERERLLRPAARLDNGYRSYGQEDLEHLRLLTDLRRLGIPLSLAARVSTLCHAGHCVDASGELASAVAAERVEIAERIAALRSLDARLADVERHVSAAPAPDSTRIGTTLPMLGEACCDAAAAAISVAERSCSCCGA